MGQIGTIQLGKNGLTEGFFVALEHLFKKHKNVKVSVLKSVCREKLALQELSREILSRLGNNYSSRIIGYTIAIKKLGKKVQK